MSVHDNFADAIQFDCETCGRQNTPKDIRKSLGVCRQCQGVSWTMTTEYLKEKTSQGIITALYDYFIGASLLERRDESFRMITPSVPSNEALEIATARYNVRGDMAYKYMAMRLLLDGERDRRILRDKGAKNCAECGVFFVPNAEKPWTIASFCSKGCLAKHNSTDDRKIAEDHALSPSQFVSVDCQCGKQYQVATIYIGTLRKCPSCGEKSLV